MQGVTSCREPLDFRFLQLLPLWLLSPLAPNQKPLCQSCTAARLRRVSASCQWQSLFMKPSARWAECLAPLKLWRSNTAPLSEPPTPSWANTASCFMLQVITISGRTIRKEAQADPEIAEHAISCIDKLLSICPEQDIRNAQELRKVRPKAV